MVKLAPFRADDSAQLFDWLQVRDYRLDSGGFQHVSLVQHEKWFHEVQCPGDSVALSVRLNSDDSLVGLVQLVAINRTCRHAELRIRLDPEQLGRGYGSEATRLLCHHAFRDLNLNRVYLYVRAANVRAIRCYEKVGFQVEGRLRQHCFVDGAYDDFVVLGLLESEMKTVD